MARYIGGLLLAALVLWTGEARGACAWVLWEEKEEIRIAHTVETVQNWTIHDARQIQVECEELLNRVWQKERDSWEQRYRDVPTVAGVGAEPGRISVMLKFEGHKFISLTARFRCLPDTIDPRGPKGAQ